MKLSVVIVNWNGEEMLDQCLESVQAQLGAAGPEVIVIDNCSTDASCAMVRRKHAGTILIENEDNIGPVRANNQGIRRSTGEYVLLLNSDAFPFDTSLLDIVAYLDAHPRAGAAGPQLLNDDGSLQPTVFPLVTLRHYAVRHFEFMLKYIMDTSPGGSAPDGAERPYAVPALSTACVVLRRACLRETRLFDERFFIYCDDNDLFRRIAATSWQVVYIPAARVIHAGGGSSPGPDRMPERLRNYTLLRHETESWHYYFFKHFGRRGLRGARLIDISAACCRIALTAVRMLDFLRLDYKKARLRHDLMRIRFSRHSAAAEPAGGRRR